MTSLLVATFVIAYAAIALEHPLAINKSATALIAAGLLWTIYAVTSGGASHVPPDLMALLKGKDVMVGVIDVASDTIETPEEVADTIGRALQFVPAARLIACTNCGLAPMSREVAEAKLKALAQGAAMARQRQAQGA